MYQPVYTSGDACQGIPQRWPLLGTVFIDFLSTTAAIGRAGSTEPLKVAFSLEGLHYEGPTGDSWMRAEDHQMIAPIMVMSFVKAGSDGARHDIEATGYGWKTDAVVAPKDTLPPLRCSMERPPRG
jgi:branched-chain amino acid transport system substrate-binding protein